MIERVLANKIAQYGPQDAIDQEHVLAELLQHYVLAGLARAGFFREAAFHGGTFLRICHDLDRFSEDLDFVLKSPDPGFDWSAHLGQTMQDLEAEGVLFELVDRSRADATVKKAFLKTDSLGKLLVLDLPHSRDPRRKIKIRLEIDTDPPAGSVFETRYLSFPMATAITTQTLESAFASKAHALLCRRYVKGRDWYDFLWYCSRRVRPNYELLGNALRQQGPYTDTPVEVTPAWLVRTLGDATSRVDWPAAASDVRRFLPPDAHHGLDLWSVDYFHHHLEILGRELRGAPH